MKPNTPTQEGVEQATRRDPYQTVTDVILKHLENGIVPWRCPWNREVGRPQNFHTERSYHGINVMLLGCFGYASPYWLTIRQANLLGGRVRKGEHGARIVKYGSYQSKPEGNGNSEKEQTRYYLRDYVVFNALQIEGIEFPEVEDLKSLSSLRRLETAARIESSMPQKPVIKEGQTVQAGYCVATDTVEIPAIGRFEKAEGYYQTLFHELIHSTGHESRLKRKSLVELDGFGGEIYSKEELVAEMGAAFLGMEAGTVQDNHEQSASYIRGWLDALGEPEHKHWIVQCAGQAQKAADFVLAKHVAEPS